MNNLCVSYSNNCTLCLSKCPVFIIYETGSRVCLPAKSLIQGLVKGVYAAGGFCPPIASTNIKEVICQPQGLTIADIAGIIFIIWLILLGVRYIYQYLRELKFFNKSPAPPRDTQQLPQWSINTEIRRQQALEDSSQDLIYKLALK